MSEPQDGASRCILVVDDEVATLKVIELALQKKGYSVVTASSAEEALEMMDRVHIDMIVADIFMPEVDGFEFLARTRRRPDTATVPFIFLTGDRTVKSKIKGLDLGVDEYVTKPCVIDELYARIEAIFRRMDAAAARAAPMGKASEGWDFSGKLAAMPPQELLQNLQLNRKSGVLRIETRFGQGEIYFDQGAAVHANFAGIDGEEAVYLLFALEDGTFDFRGNVKPTVRTIGANTSSLLLEGMRRMDETKAILVMRDQALKRVAGE